MFPKIIGINSKVGTVKISGETGTRLQNVVLEDIAGNLYKIDGTYKIGPEGFVEARARRITSDPLPKICLLLFAFLLLCCLAACQTKPVESSGAEAQIKQLQKTNQKLQEELAAANYAADVHHTNSKNWLEALEMCTGSSYGSGWQDEVYEAGSMGHNCDCYDEETCGE